MNYKKVTMKISPDEDYLYDIAMALLAESGFESFERCDDGMAAYCQVVAYDKESVAGIEKEMPIEGVKVEWSEEEIEDKDWNEQWERENFTPIEVEGRCRIHAPGVESGDEVEYDIVIDPKMSFGTGHHATTCMMLSLIMAEDVEGKRVMDMGCGTAVLGILAMKRGAKSVVAVDIDEWAYRNACENAKNNGCGEMEVELGGKDAIRGRKFDLLLANINRNILVDGMELYAGALESGGVMMLSGFLGEDVEIMRECGKKYGVEMVEVRENGDWRAMKLIKR